MHAEGATQAAWRSGVGLISFLASAVTWALSAASSGYESGFDSEAPSALPLHLALSAPAPETNRSRAVQRACRSDTMSGPVSERSPDEGAVAPD